MKYIIRKDLYFTLFIGITLYRIQRISDGLLGGYIEYEGNLSQEGTCFIHDTARVYGYCRVIGDAQVYGDGTFYRAMLISGNSQAHGRFILTLLP